MFNVKRVRSWNVNGNDLDAMVKFYRDFLGGSQGRDATIGGVSVAHVNLGDLTVGIFDALEGARPGVPHHTFEIAWPGDADSVVKELEAQGIKVEGVRQHREDAGYSVYVNDPGGNRIELAAAPA